jgi:tRNA nucleotidyltransferase/poly(A) polymerase
VAVLAVQPGWSVDPDVESAARAAAPSLRESSAERVRDELVALVNGPAAGQGFRLLDRLGVVDVVLPESAAMRSTPQPAPHRFDVWEHSLRAVEAMDEIAARLDRLAPWGDELAGHLAEGLGDGLGRAGALKLAALLHDVAKPETRSEADGRVRFIGTTSSGPSARAGSPGASGYRAGPPACSAGWSPST